MSEAFDSLTDSERLLHEAQEDPARAPAAAQAALRGLLIEWGVTPRGETIVELLEQAAETDDTLLHFRPEAALLDSFEPGEQPEAAEHAKIFVDAARARLANI
jgi:HEPN domain-containing protein